MRHVVLSSAFLFASFDSRGQTLIQELGGGVGLQGVQYIGPDALADALLLTGFFTYANDVQVSPGIIQWNSDLLTSLGCGVEWNCISPTSPAGMANPTIAVARWGSDIYLGGSFSFSRNGMDYNGIMRWDGAEWYPLQAGVDGRVTSIKVIEDELIVAGWFTYADTVFANGLARWDGTAWHRVFDVPDFFIGDGPNQVQDVERFQGEWYIGGNLPLGDDLVKWNGTACEIVGGGFIGPFSQVNKLRLHDDRLYVAGSFAQCPPTGVATNAGSGIVAWNGTAWDALGGGTCGSSNPAVMSMAWWNDELYACGTFNRMGGQLGGQLAKWDGTEWCMMAPPGYWGTGAPGALAVYHDSLYVGGAYVVAGDDSISCFGKWIGEDYTYACGSLTGMPASTTAPVAVSVWPNPGSDLIYVQGPLSLANGAHVLFADALGRIVLSVSCAHGEPIDVSHLATGTYTVQVHDKHTGVRLTARFIRL